MIPPQNAIKQLFAPEVITVARTIDSWHGSLYPEEALCIESAGPKRRREFTAGRLCAREALYQLGITDWPLLVGTQREPLWPAGVIGSLSHCDGFCAAAVVRRGCIIGIGLDVETAEPLAPELIPLICTPLEVAWSQQVAPPSYCDWYKLIFSAKESLYKCYFPLTRTYIDFHDAEIQIFPKSRQFSVRLSNNVPAAFPHNSTFCGRFVVNHNYIVTALTLAAPDFNPAKIRLPKGI